MRIENFTKFMKYYGKGRKLKLFGFFLLSLITGSFEFLGITLIYPFILLVVKPELVINSKIYSDFAAFIHSTDVAFNTFILGLIATLVFILKSLFMIFTLYLQNKFINNWKLDLNKKFIHYYLFSSYKNSLKTSPYEKGFVSGFVVNQTLDSFIFKIINLITNITIVIMILILLFMKFLFAATVTSIFIIFSMVSQDKFFKNKIREISQVFLKTSILANKRGAETIDNLKGIKILSAENYFYNEYVASQENLSSVIFKKTFLESIPPYVIEILAVFSLFILAVIISLQNMNNTSWMIASYAVIVASLFRIAPALNRIQSAINAINTSRDFVKTMLTEYENNDLEFSEEKFDFDIEFNNSIKLKDISFAYKTTPVIKDLNLEIKKGEFVGIIGLSGAGKSTLADIIMGLLPVDNGKIYLDDIELDSNNFILLRKLIGYVPQHITTLDSSFKLNVAWGIKEEEIDEQKVIDCLKMAQLYDFVNELEGGINANVILGATGLSQGQRQRLAIARALYRDAKILILDEATSALDVKTENEITQILNSIRGEKTIIAIAHRLSTLKSCNRLIYLKDGTIVDTGTFEELSSKHPDFENLINLSNLNIK